jgi:hypothetical protein
MSTIGSIFGLNFLLSMTPCYSDGRYEKARLGLNVVTILCVIAAVLVWGFVYADNEEL